MDSPAVKRRNNSLTQAQASRLYRWLDESRTFASTATAQKCAELAVVELKFGITASNVLSAKRALGITKPAPVKPARECKCADLAAAMIEWMTSGDASAGAYQRYVTRLRAIAGKPAYQPQAPTLPGVVVPVAPGVSLAMGEQQGAA